jgi:Glycosyl hydrolase family 47
VCIYTALVLSGGQATPRHPNVEMHGGGLPPSFHSGYAWGKCSEHVGGQDSQLAPEAGSSRRARSPSPHKSDVKRTRFRTSWFLWPVILVVLFVLYQGSVLRVPRQACITQVRKIVCELERLRRLLCYMTRSLQMACDIQLEDNHIFLSFFDVCHSILITEWSQDGAPCQHGTQNVSATPQLDDTALNDGRGLQKDEIITSGAGEQGKQADKLQDTEREAVHGVDAEPEQVKDLQREPEEQTGRLPIRPITTDDSVRCRASDICEAEAGRCHASRDNLGCVLSADERREHVVGAIRWAWSSYRKCAWGQDEISPISCHGRQWFGLGLTLVDSLDTLILAGLEEVRVVALSIIQYMHVAMHSIK